MKEVVKRFYMQCVKVSSSKFNNEVSYFVNLLKNLVHNYNQQTLNTQFLIEFLHFQSMYITCRVLFFSQQMLPKVEKIVAMLTTTCPPT
jgi:hypothetical protein